jgi:cytochrome c
MTERTTAWRSIALPLLLLVASASPVAAQAVGDPDAGRHLSQTWCANCHVVSVAQPRGASTGAPSFREIAAQKSVTPMALSAFLQTPHHRMPDLHLSRNEIDDVSAYILSLRQPRKP